MGFTIGGIRDLRPGTRRRGRASECTVVAEYTGLHGWDVVPGARATALSGERGARCSCGAPQCAAPGAHPLRHAPTVPAGSTLREVAAAWAELPGTAVLLPVGRSFDVIEVGATAGRQALVRMERMGLPLGPVAVTPHGRAHFLVAPGASAELPDLLYRMGWDGARLDLRCLPPGSHITAPPSDLAGLGPVRWLRPPELGTAVRPPHARLLLGTLAYVCHRSAAR
ncbi:MULTISPECIES: bifunctional DNA primase/polymerase [Streptomyces]|uniref:bifunctional DNA primase/polymerase n=1 Tax=Streptomyces TaxID=1883 RepID=UPI001D14E777|nr:MULTISPECIES: bifunctional DNA primase/polymerase [Streptomyces]MCC3651469.1 bifunctional DNA primase/polymerase [Streptomyces sp. S07_1.15]WSQ73736.1 bifunctional DNA primase/polymerase [Streptomyces xinghaiensis]